MSNKEVGIKKMFDGIHKRYDLLNHLMSAGRDIAWRKKCCKKLLKYSGGVGKNAVVLDLCGGTGDFSLAYKKILGNPKLCLVGDFSDKMLLESVQKNAGTPVQMDATNIPLSDNSVDFILNGFGMRNIPNLDAAFAEAFRVLKVGGIFITLEFFKPSSTISKLFYEKIAPFAIPFAGMILSKHNAYRYLVLSILNFLTPKEYAIKARSFGFKTRCVKAFDGGLSYMVMAEKAEYAG
ncbi:demethylmenaquinone methyltransferase [Fibrobacterales bacterium]|nr:demethylmenaquinone methyltransferase [Fibrobacterales bacterium]